MINCLKIRKQKRQEYTPLRARFRCVTSLGKKGKEKEKLLQKRKAKKIDMQKDKSYVKLVLYQCYSPSKNKTQQQQKKTTKKSEKTEN